MVFEITNPETITDPHLVQLGNSGVNPTAWDMEALNHHIRRQRQQQEQEQQQQQMGYSFDENVYNDESNQSFGSMIGEASSSNAMENFELPLEMNSLRKEMGFLEMISQGNL